MPPRYTDAQDAVLTAVEALNAAHGRFEAKYEAEIARVGTIAAAAKTAAEALETEFARAAVLGGRSVTLGQDKLSDEFMALLRTGANGTRIRAALTSDIGPGGGFLAPPQFAATIDRLLRNANPFYDLAYTPPTVNAPAYLHPFSKNNAVAVWVGEEETRDETDAGDGGLAEIPRHEIYAMPKISLRLLEDSSYDVAADLQQNIADGFAETTGTAFAAGNGVKKPRGFLSYPTATTADATRPINTIQYFVTGVDGAFHATVPGDVFITTVHGLKQGYRTGASWLMNSATAGGVRKLKDLEGRYLWRDAMEDGQPDRLLGYPVTEWEAMPDIATDAFPIAFGNWRRAYAIPQGEFMLILDNITAPGFMRYHTRRRVGGGLTNASALKLIKFGDA